MVGVVSMPHDAPRKDDIRGHLLRHRHQGRPDRPAWCWRELRSPDHLVAANGSSRWRQTTCRCSRSAAEDPRPTTTRALASTSSASRSPTLRLQQAATRAPRTTTSSLLVGAARTSDKGMFLATSSASMKNSRYPRTKKTRVRGRARASALSNQDILPSLAAGASLTPDDRRQCEMRALRGNAQLDRRARQSERRLRTVRQRHSRNSLRPSRTRGNPTPPASRNALDLSVQGELFRLAHATAAMLIPEAWAVISCPTNEEPSVFDEYYAATTEPWDGPVCVALHRRPPDRPVPTFDTVACVRLALPCHRRRSVSSWPREPGCC